MVSTNINENKLKKGGLHARLREVQNLVSESQASFAREIGSSPANVSNYLRARTDNVPARFISKIVNKYPNVNARWLLTGEGMPILDREDEEGALTPRLMEWPDFDSPSRGMTIRVPPRGKTRLVPFYDKPVYSDWNAQAEASEHFSFSRTWIRNKVGINPDLAFVVQVFGTAMEDLFSDGDVAIGERCDEIRYDGIYALAANDRLLVRHVECRGEQVRLLSHSPPYSTIEVRRGDIRMLGKVVRRIVKF